jgi:ubiquinone/menaquinone biosynthesis C-methylase UbiE
LPSPGGIGYYSAVELSEVIALIEPATGRPSGTWADLGAGSGLFSRALAAMLGDRGRVIAVDIDARALEAIERPDLAASIETVVADVRAPDAIPALRDAALDGAVLANVLHFVHDPGDLLRRLRRLLVPGARVVVVEYDRERANRWVPHPLTPARLAEVAREAGLTPPRVVARRPSAYQGVMYCARLSTRDRVGTEG